MKPERIDYRCLIAVGDKRRDFLLRASGFDPAVEAACKVAKSMGGGLGNIILLGPHTGNPEITDREPDIEEKEMYYEEEVINGRLCWRGLPGEEWKPFTQAELTTKLLETRDTLIKLTTETEV